MTGYPTSIYFFCIRRNTK